MDDCDRKKPRCDDDGHEWEIHHYLNCCALGVVIVAALGVWIAVQPKLLTFVLALEAAKTVPMPSSNLHQHLGELLRSGTGADVTFLVSGESLVAHKNILAARSPVLMAEFFGHPKEASAGRVVVKDMEVAVFKAMLHFVYTDTVPEFDRELEAMVTMAQHLLVAADRYGLESLDRLKVICEGKLSSGITVDTAARTLALVEQHNCPHLKAKCVEFIVSNPVRLDAVLGTEGYKHLEATCPSALTGILKSMCEKKLKRN